MPTSLLFFALLALGLLALGLFLFLPVRKLHLLARDPEDFEHLLTVDGFEIFYQDLGKGTPVVFLHGLGASTFCWRYQLQELSQNFRVIVPDLPGFGRSSKITSATYDLESQVARVSEFLDKLKLKKFVLVGSSMGGLLGLSLAARLPSRVKSLVLLAPATNPKVVPMGLSRLGWASHIVWPMVNEKLVERIMKKVNANPERITPDTIKEATRHFETKESVATFIKATQTLRDRSILSLPESVNVPTLVLYGQKDNVVPRWIVDDLVKRLPQAQLAVHTEAGHHLQEDEYEWVNDKIKDFAESR